jgi:hypothetical protein
MEFAGSGLDPADLAVSKLAAGRPKDLDFVRVLLREDIVAPDALRARIDAVPSLNESGRRRIHDATDRLIAAR